MKFSDTNIYQILSVFVLAIGMLAWTLLNIVTGILCLPIWLFSPSSSRNVYHGIHYIKKEWFAWRPVLLSRGIIFEDEDIKPAIYGIRWFRWVKGKSAAIGPFYEWSDIEKEESV